MPASSSRRTPVVYESEFRSRWDRAEETDLVVLRSASHDLDALPYDLLQAGRKLSFNLGDLFPNLSCPVVAVLDRADLDALFDAQLRHAPGQLGHNATKEFVLRFRGRWRWKSSRTHWPCFGSCCVVITADNESRSSSMSVTAGR